MENGNAGVSCPALLLQPAEKSKHTKTSCKSFKALPEAVTGAPAFGFREVFCVSGNAMIHTDISLSAAALFCHGKKKEQAGGKGMASGGPSLSLCQKSLSVKFYSVGEFFQKQ